MIREKYYTDEQKEIFKFGKILLGVVLIFGLMYLFTTLVNKGDKYKRTNNAGEIQYDSIIIGTMLNRADAEYYVLITDKSTMDNLTVISKASNYKNGAGNLPIYTADLSLEFNKNFISGESHYNEDNLDDFTVKGTTLVKVKNGKIIKFIEEKDKILEELN